VARPRGHILHRKPMRTYKDDQISYYHYLCNERGNKKFTMRKACPEWVNQDFPNIYVQFCYDERAFTKRFQITNGLQIESYTSPDMLSRLTNWVTSSYESYKQKYDIQGWSALNNYFETNKTLLKKHNI
jgi:hypothetical protein